MAKRNKQIKHTVFYVVQQLNLPIPRVFVIKLKMISENSSRMNFPEFSLKITKFRSFTMVHDLSIYREGCRILSHIFWVVTLFVNKINGFKCL